MSVVRYTPDLQEHALKIARAMHAEANYNELPLNEKKLLALIASPNVFVVMYLFEGEYIGGMLGAISPHYFTDGMVAKDLMLYVLPKWRGRCPTAAVRMIRAFEEWAASKGVKEVYLSQSIGIDIEMTTNFYKKMGYSVMGSITKKELHHV